MNFCFFSEALVGLKHESKRSAPGQEIGVKLSLVHDLQVLLRSIKSEL